jgi:ribosome biogenesis ATPase
LAYSIAGELGLPFYKATGPELIGGTSGESESRVREIFEVAAAAAPSILFIDGIDVIAGKRDSSQRGMDKRLVLTPLSILLLLTLLIILG